MYTYSETDKPLWHTVTSHADHTHVPSTTSQLHKLKKFQMQEIGTMEGSGYQDHNYVHVDSQLHVRPSAVATYVLEPL